MLILVFSCDESASDVSTLIMNTSAPDALGLTGNAAVVQLGIPPSTQHHIHPTSNPSSPFTGNYVFLKMDLGHGLDGQYVGRE